MTGVLPVRWHPLVLGVLAIATMAYVVIARRARFEVSRRQRWCFAGAVAAFTAAYWWPLGDLSSHVSLAALVAQRLLVLVAACPLLLTSLPVELVARATRPAPVDAVASACSRPAIAVLLVTVVGSATLLPGVVAWTLGSTAAATVVAVVNVALGIVLWLPVLAVVPGARRVGTIGKGVYLLVASLVVTVFSIVWIFARHPMYAAFHHQRLVLGISPLLDQQLAGFVAKLGAYAPMWTIAFVLLGRAGDGEGDADPLRWVDVERELERGRRRGSSPPAAPQEHPSVS